MKVEEDYKLTKHFKASELMCKCGCKNLVIDESFIQKIQLIREILNRPLIITSSYRCPQHPEETKKEKPGYHSSGIAVDIKVSNGKERFELVSLALKLGFTGIGVANSFVHLDMRPKEQAAMWSY